MLGKRSGFSPGERRQGVIDWASKEAYPKREISRQVTYYAVFLRSMPSDGEKKKKQVWPRGGHS